MCGAKTFYHTTPQQQQPKRPTFRKSFGFGHTDLSIYSWETGSLTLLARHSSWNPKLRGINVILDSFKIFVTHTGDHQTQTVHILHDRTVSYRYRKKGRPPLPSNRMPNSTAFQLAHVANTKSTLSSLNAKPPKVSWKRRTVCFASPLEIHHASNWDDQFQIDDFKLSLWWSREDFVSIMSKAIRTSVEARKHTMLPDAIDKAFTHSKEEAHTLGDQGHVDEYLNLLSDEDRGLRLWCQYGHSRRGLERFTSRLYQETKRSDRAKIVRQVVILSKSGAKPDVLRRVSERTSRSSGIFARMLGIADANAAMSQSLSLEYPHCTDAKTVESPKKIRRSDVMPGKSQIVPRSAA